MPQNYNYDDVKKSKKEANHQLYDSWGHTIWPFKDSFWFQNLHLSPALDTFFVSMSVNLGILTEILWEGQS